MTKRKAIIELYRAELAGNMTKREAIIEFYRAGKSISKIIKQLKVPKSTVYDAVSRYKELSNTKRPRSCRTKNNIKAV